MLDEINYLIRPDLRNSVNSFLPPAMPIAENAIRMDHNELPYPPYDSPKETLNRYPERHPIKLQKRMAELYGIDEKTLSQRAEAVKVLTYLCALCAKQGIAKLYKLCQVLNSYNMPQDYKIPSAKSLS